MSLQQRLKDKILKRGEASARISAWKKQGKRIVFTNGCFDLLHRGHIDYLSKARDLGDILVIGLNSDESVRTLNKGVSRPLQDEMSRAEILAALECVDLVCLFSESTPQELIEELHPDILVKGGDYSPEQVIGKDFVEKSGGKLVLIPFLPGYSTSAIEQKIKKAHGV